MKLAIVVCVVVILNLGKSDERGARVRRIVGGGKVPAPPEDDPVVFTRFSERSARVVGARDFPHYVFRGIRYAYAPVGKDRFLRPRQYFLEGNENATSFPPPCVQPVPGKDQVIGSEDCLFLNVFTATLPTGMEGLPVVVWIHGGGYRYGSASQYGVRHLVGKQVVVVTIQYRLGSIGFLTTGSKDLPGNAALWDMLLAVQWVRNYIGFFGGNPNKITVMGQGTGGSSAISVALAGVARGLTSGVVAMSGNSASHFATDSSTVDTARWIADQNGCPMSSPITMVKCLQNLSPDSIIKGDSYIEFEHLAGLGFVSGMSGRVGNGPFVEGVNDGRSLPGLLERDPVDQLSSDGNPKIPLLTGVAKDETKRACHGRYKSDIVQKLKIPNFMDKILVTNLQNTIKIGRIKAEGNESSGSAQTLWSALDPFQFGNYLKVSGSNLQDRLAKVSEVTGDALFNVPAFLTADLWSRKGGRSFLYRFDHAGKRSRGHHFLMGSPLVGNDTDADDDPNTVGHGDELGFLFDAHDVYGNPLDSENRPKDDSDDKVRDIFTQLIADFARFGKVSVGGGQELKPFTSSESNFIQISSKPKAAKDFRFCQMALWCGLAQRLQSATCNFLKVLGSQIKGTQDTVSKALKNATDISGLGNIGNLGGVVPQKQQKGTPTRAPAKKGGDLLGGVVKPLNPFGGFGG